LIISLSCCCTWFILDNILYM